MQKTFHKLARLASDGVGSPYAFFIAFLLVILWSLSGPLFGFSDTWQLVINTSTTIVTFLMVFLIQSSQNRDSLAMQLKLDELLRAVDAARNGLIDLENMSEEQIDYYHKEFTRLQKKADLRNKE